MPTLGAEGASDLALCHRILASGSKSFWVASRLLPRRVRDDAAVVYAFCRTADDAVDECEGDPRVALEECRIRLQRIFDASPNADPVDRALSRVVAARELPRLPFEALLDGFAWDVEGRRYRTLGDLTDYAARAAGTVGVLMTLLMGQTDPDALARACELGVAMQLSNIARDVGEDARRGRLYLPTDWMESAGLDVDRFLANPVPSSALATVVERLLNEADMLYARSDAGIPMLSRRFRVAIRCARLVYADLHRSVARNAFDTITSRAVVGRSRKTWLLCRSFSALLWRRADTQRAVMPPIEQVRFLTTGTGVGGATGVSDLSRPSPR